MLISSAFPWSNLWWNWSNSSFCKYNISGRYWVALNTGSYMDHTHKTWLLVSCKLTKCRNCFKIFRPFPVFCCNMWVKCSSVILVRYLHIAGWMSPLCTGIFSYIVKKRASCSKWWKTQLWISNNATLLNTLTVIICNQIQSFVEMLLCILQYWKHASFIELFFPLLSRLFCTQTRITPWK